MVHAQLSYAHVPPVKRGNPRPLGQSTLPLKSPGVLEYWSTGAVGWIDPDSIGRNPSLLTLHPPYWLN